MNPEIKQCQNCKQNFTIEPEDFAFYAKIKVPAPTWCPECRMVRRMNWRNERTLYKRKCDAPGHSEDIISVYHKDSPFKVYDQKYWWSDEWDAMNYGKDYDFNKPFFKQFWELLLEVPRHNLMGKNNVNSEYGNYIDNSKDCYLSTGIVRGENLLYSNHSFDGKDSSDLYFTNKLEFSYENVICQNSYRLFFSQNSENCTDSYFLYNCRNCSNCFGCVHLRNKQYHIFNKPYSKEEYQQKIRDFDLGSFRKIEEYGKMFNELKLNFPRKFINEIKSNSVSGDNITEAKNCKSAFDILAGGSENSKFVYWAGVGMREVYDSTAVGSNCELLYENIATVFSLSKIFFSNLVWNSSHDVYYSFNCHNVSNLFGCVGLRNKQYCILNKQYSKEEYEKLVPKIIEHMNEMPYISRKSEILNPKSETNSKSQIQNSQTREIVYRYGEFFPPELSPFAYNETIAQEYFPLSAEAAAKAGFNWKQPETRNIKIDLKTEDLPDHIKDVPDSIIGKVIQCTHAKFNMGTSDVPGINNNLRTSDVQKLTVTCNEQCTEAFKIIEPELQFYKKMNLPLPRLCPNCRHYQRLKQRNPLKLWKRKCQCAGIQSDNQIYKNTIAHTHNKNHCENEFETTYSPDRPEIIYCEKCYQQEVV